MIIKYKNKLLVVSALAMGGCLSTTASAQDGGGSSGPNVLEEIMVTARRMEENVQEVPISLQVYNQQQISNLNIVNAVDLATYTPSLAANTSFGSDNASLAIRGFRQDLDTAPTVGIYFADVVVPRGATQGAGTRDAILPGSMFDLQNIQVLKGPQGTLFGRNTTGGAVLLVPQKPADSFEAYVEGSVGNYDMWRLQGMVNTPLGEDIRLRVALDRQERDGFLDNTAASGSDTFENLNYDSLRASLVWDVTSKLENYTIASFYKSATNSTLAKLIACNPTGYDPVNVPAGLANFIGGLSCGQLNQEKAQGADFYDVQAPFNGVSRIEQWQVINTTTWEIRDDVTIKNIASYGIYQNTQKTPLFGTSWSVDTLPAPYPSIFSFGAPPYFTAINAAPGKMSADQSTYTEELQVQGSLLAERLTYQAGAYFEWSDPESTVGNQTPALVDCTDLASLDCTDPLGMAFTQFVGVPIQVGQVVQAQARTSFRNRGLYAQTTYSFTDQLRLTGGLRYTWDKQTVDTGSVTSRFDVTPPYTDPPVATCTDIFTEPTCRQSLTTKSDKPTWLIGLDWFPTDDIMVFTKYARGYRAGGIVNRAPFDYRTFGPEKLDDYEMGVKTSFEGTVSGTFNVTGFYNDLTNQQIQIGFDPVGGRSPTTGIVNAGKSRVYGAEVEASLIPMEDLVFNLSYTYLDAEIRKIDDIETQDPLWQARSGQIGKGSPILQTPDNQVNLSAYYTLPLDAEYGSVTLGLTYVYIDNQYTNYLYTDPRILAIYGQDYGKLASIDLLNVSVDWDDVIGLPVDLSLFATNVTDEEYYAYHAGLGSNGLETAVLGQPRMYGMRVRYRFGD